MFTELVCITLILSLAGGVGLLYGYLEGPKGLMAYVVCV